VLDYCGGGDIRKLSQKQKLTEMDVKRFMFQLASALAYMHARHVIHRDVKASKVPYDTSCPYLMFDTTA
jgi:serine/threonine protein kinase